MSFPYHRGHPNSAEMTQRGTSNWGTREQRVEEGNRTLMEEENDRKWEALGDQVNLLKSLTKEIHGEVDSQNDLIDKMGSSFGTAGEFYKNTIGKMTSMLTTSSSYHMYYLVAFVVFVFLVLYFLMRRK